MGWMMTPGGKPRPGGKDGGGNGGGRGRGRGGGGGAVVAFPSVALKKSKSGFKLESGGPLVAAPEGRLWQPRVLHP